MMRPKSESRARRPTVTTDQPKDVPRSIRIGQRGINLIERIVEEEMGHLWTPTRPASDAGTDGFIELCDHERGASGQIVQVQSKATLGTFQHETAAGFEYACDERDLDRWLGGNAPFILVVSRPPNEAYWIPIKSYFADSERRARRIVEFDKRAHAFDRNAADALRTMAVPRTAGIYTQTPAPRDESLVSNLLPVSRVTQRIYAAGTDFREPKPLREALKAHIEFPRGEWFLKNERLWSFHDLRKEPWNHVCDQSSVKEFSSDQWSLSHDREQMNDFVRLLRSCLDDHLGRRGVRFYRRKKGLLGYYCFKATKDLKPRVERWRALQKWAERTVFEAYENKVDASRIAYYRHLAFQPRFRRFSGQWYLEITPTYHFTRDGKEPDRYREERLSKIKRIEKNAAVLANVLFWGRFISDSDDLFRKGNEFVQFACLVDQAVGFGVNDEEWKNNAEADEKTDLDLEGGQELLLQL